MRHNSGGTDGLDLIVPSRLTDRKYVAYSKEARDNPTGLIHFTPPQQAWVNPVDRPGFRGPTILLTGQDCASDCETFVLATMGRQPAIVRIGDPTEGIFSNLLERRLPNGWRFELSNEVFHAMDGRVFEAVGVPPDIAIPLFTQEDATNRRDPAIERALTILNSVGQH